LYRRAVEAPVNDGEQLVNAEARPLAVSFEWRVTIGVMASGAAHFY
jgi:hypothetical protein